MVLQPDQQTGVERLLCRNRAGRTSGDGVGGLKEHSAIGSRHSPKEYISRAVQTVLRHRLARGSHNCLDWDLDRKAFADERNNFRRYVRRRLNEKYRTVADPLERD